MTDNNQTEVKDEQEIKDEEQKRLMIFGRNVAEIPCFRSSFLYGSGGGFATGLLAFLATSRPQMSMHFGFGAFMFTTVGYWFTCRYQYSQQKFFYSQLQPLMRKQALYEGTALEQEVQKKSVEA